MKVVKLANEQLDFYGLLGPYLANREVVKEVGGPVWDDPGKTWYVAIAEPTDERRTGIEIGQVMGFCAARGLAGRSEFESHYLRPECDKRVLARLAKARDKDWRGPARAVVRGAAAEVLRDLGFRSIAKRGRFDVLARGDSDG